MKISLSSWAFHYDEENKLLIYFQYQYAERTYWPVALYSLAAA